MKELIVVIGLTLLGCVLFDMIAGDTGSLRDVSGEKLMNLVELYGEESR